jgi:hypothetical protein
MAAFQTKPEITKPPYLQAKAWPLGARKIWLKGATIVADT